MIVRVILERPGAGVRYVETVKDVGGARDFLERVRLELRAMISEGGCKSLTVSVHENGEGCDHA